VVLVLFRRFWQSLYNCVILVRYYKKTACFPSATRS